MKTTLDLAMIRWAVVCGEWSETAVGHFPNLGAFLAGWFCRDAGIPIKAADGITFINSWRKGWIECNVQIAIMDQAALTAAGQES